MSDPNVFDDLDMPSTSRHHKSPSYEDISLMSQSQMTLLNEKQKNTQENKTLNYLSQLHNLKRRSTLMRNAPNVNAKGESHMETEEKKMVKSAVKNIPTLAKTKWILGAIRTLPLPIREKRNYKDKLINLRLGGKTLPSNKKSGLSMDFIAKQKVFTAFRNFISMFEVWATPLKFIEGHFGTGVVSYFVFLRWLMVLNLILFVINIVFIILPQILGSPIPDDIHVEAVPINDSFSGKTFISPSLSSLSSLSFLHSTNTSLLTKLVDSSPTLSSLKLIKTETLPTSNTIDFDDLASLGSLLDNYGKKGFIDSTLYYSRENYTTELRRNISGMCLKQYANFLKNNTRHRWFTKFLDFIQGTGWLENTFLFIGYYRPEDLLYGSIRYSMSLAFLAILAVSFGLSIIIMLIHASKGVEESMLEHNLQEPYSYLLLCSWDYSVTQKTTAEEKHNSIMQELMCSLKEAREEAEMKNWTIVDKFRVYFVRTFVHILSVCLLICSYIIIYRVAHLQLQLLQRQHTDIKKLAIEFMPSVTLTVLNSAFPVILGLLVPFESYKKKNQISITLLRVICMREASIIILLFSFYNELKCQPKDICLQGRGTCKSPICWETYVGQQMYRLAIVDVVASVSCTLFLDTFRRELYKRFPNRFTRLVGRPSFDIPLEVIALVYSQTIYWLGLFFCTIITGIAVIKCTAIFYCKKFTLIRNCVTENVIYKSSRSNEIFVFVLMVSFFISLTAIGYSVSQLQPSPSCSPFRLYDHMTHSVKYAIEGWSSEANVVLDFIFNPLFIVPIVIMLSLILYYYITKAMADMKMAQSLKVQLTLEGKDKQFLLNRVTKMRPETQLG